jgi:hypothetical protein
VKLLVLRKVLKLASIRKVGLEVKVRKQNTGFIFRGLEIKPNDDAIIG